MDIKTILILVNIAIIGIIAIILVKVYYKNDESDPKEFGNNTRPPIQTNNNSTFDIDEVQTNEDDSIKNKFTGIINSESVKDKIISAKDSGKESLKYFTQDNSKKKSEMDHRFDYDDYNTDNIISTANYENHISGLADLKENANLPEEKIASNVFQEPIEEKHKNMMEQNKSFELSEPKLVTKKSASQTTTIKEYPDENILEPETLNEDSTFKGPSFEDIPQTTEEKETGTIPEETQTFTVDPEEVPTTIEEKYAEKESEFDDVFDDEITSITPIHDVSPEETKEFFEQLDPETEEPSSEEQNYLQTLKEEEFDDNLVASKTDDLSIDISSKSKVEEKVPEALIEDNEFERLLKGESVATPTNSKTKVKTSSESKIARFSINGNEETLKKGTSIIYKHRGETYESSIKQIKDGKLLVTYRRQNIWIKPSDIKKVF